MKDKKRYAAAAAVGAVTLLFFIPVFCLLLSFTRFEVKAPSEPADYHFVLVGKALEDPFWKEIYRGARAAAEKNNVALEIVGSDIEKEESELAYLDMAIAAKVDGIITHVTHSNAAKDYIDKAVGKGIPSFTLETDSPESMRRSFIGVNSYNLGTEWGKQLIDLAQGEPLRAVMLVGKQGEADGLTSEETAEGLMYSGVLDAVREHANITVDSCGVDRSEPFGTEEALKALIREETADVIICTTADGTVSAAETLINMNMVGKIRLVGYHDSKEILNYIKKGILYATVSVDAYQMGYRSVQAMAELKKNGGTNQYITTPVTVITAQNISEYLNDEASAEG